MFKRRASEQITGLSQLTYEER